MGTDTPIAVLSSRPRLLFDYFSQLFAQVTNPPLDAIREEVVTSVSSTIGPESNLLAPGPESCRQLALPFPIIDNDELSKIVHANDGGKFPGLRSYVVKGLYRVSGGGLALERALAAICGEVTAAIEDGARVIVLSDRNADEVEAPIPSLLLTGGRAPPPRAHQAAHDGRSPRRVRRRPRGAPHGAPHRLRRRRHQPVPGLRVDRGPHRRGHARARGHRSGQGHAQLHQGVRQGRAQGDVQDRHLDRRQLHRGPDLRGRRPRRRARRAVLHRDGQPPRWHRAPRDRHRGRRPPRRGPPDPARGAGPPQARARRRVPVAPRGRGPPVQPGDRLQAAARHAGQALRHLPPVLPARRRPVEATGHAARAVRPALATARRSRSRTSSRRRRSCAGSPPGP